MKADFELDIKQIEKRILAGDDYTAYRDPCAYYHNGIFHIFFTLVETIDGKPYLYIATVTSSDLIYFSKVKKLTEKNNALNYSSPGSILEFNGEYWLCFQSYPRENGEKYANSKARLFTMRTTDFKSWTTPQQLMVKGNIPNDNYGRMIDPYLVRDKDNENIIWCFYKQNGVTLSRSADMVNWEYVSSVNGGENVCVLTHNNKYIMFHSPEDDGIAIKESEDLVNWRDIGEKFFLDAKSHMWSKGRVTAAFILEYKDNKQNYYIMFYHASGPENESVHFDTNASIAIKTSRDLLNWHA